MQEEFKPTFENTNDSNEHNDNIIFKCGNCKVRARYNKDDLTKLGHTYNTLYSTIHDAFLCVPCIELPFYEILTILRE